MRHVRKLSCLLLTGRPHLRAPPSIPIPNTSIPIPMYTSVHMCYTPLIYVRFWTDRCDSPRAEVS